MEKTRIAKVEDVTLARRGEQVVGALHLTPHHLIFSHTPPLPDDAPSEAPKPRPRELWITYPIISFCTLKPSPAASRQPSSIRVRCRDFTYVCFYFASDSKAREVFDTIKSWTCKLGKIEKLYAFSYKPQTPEKDVDGWKIYDPRKEWKRLGVCDDGPQSSWRISKINTDYGFSPSYPSLILVPTAISDNTINYAGRYRSRARIPALTYLHPVNNCSITRCSQPLVGVRGNRSIQDEKLLGAIFSTSEPGANLAQSSSPPPERDSMQSSQEEPPTLQPDVSFSNAEELEDEVIAKINSDGKPDKQQIYGAQQHNLIVDARPTVNAFAMQAVGLGSENMDNYRFATKVYLGIDNIHVMRKSLNRVIEALKDSDVTPLRPNREELAKSNWLKHIASILDGAGLIARQVGLQHSHVLIHCSDGWDRTSQLSALSQLCLDPYYRTLEGFIVLVEKDWLSFGHRFRLRAGYLNSEKWFHIENERIGGSESNRSGIGGTTGTGKALENALLSAKGFFNRDNVSKDSLPESDGEMQPYDSDSPQAIRPTKQPKGEDKEATKVNETSPVFHQFLDATYQLLYQHPTRFEFNERFLRRLLYHLYSCQYGTFLFDSEKDRTEAKLSERTRSVWDYFISRKEQFTNPKYEPIIDDNKRGQERLIFPRAEETRWWSEGFGRTDSEMNAPPPSNGSMGSIDVPGRPRTPVLTGVETADNAVGTGIAGKQATSMASIAASLSNFGLSPGRSSTDGRKSPTRAKEDMEVEMQ